ncbi:MAG: VWA domain-containing protein [Rhodospirillales bacterium]|nr:VWA domain-containing protein [Rhodospirillales bacterium]MDP6644208.1 VWA domain-containing protein [Rhodospirillales bacterium]
MFVDFFLSLKKAHVPVTLREYLTLLEAMEKGIADYDVNDFYFLSRSCLIKDERNLDKFDRVFGTCFKGLERIAEDEGLAAEIPEEWLRKLAERILTPEEMAEIEAMGGLEELLETLKERLAEQNERHQGGSKWIGTGGTSPFGAWGYNPEGVRIGQDRNRHNRAVKVWDKRQFKNLDADVEIGTRNIKMALRRLRRFAREGAAEELDLPDTIKSTAHNGGFLDLKMVPERHNAVKVLLLFDVGGSMDPYVRVCEELFSAVRSEFKHLEYFYFHNCLYEGVWKDNRRRHNETLSVYDLVHTYPADYKLIFVGDATMSPYEITYPNGSVEHFNEEPGAVWMQRVLDVYSRAAWLNPVKEAYWPGTHSVQLMQQIMGGRMYPLTLDGLDGAMRELSH